MEFGKGSWKVVGVFDAGGSAYESEIWGDVNQMAADFDRQGGYSSAYLRATDPIAADALKNRVSDDQRLKLEGMFWRRTTIRQADQVRSSHQIYWHRGRDYHGDRIELSRP
jgi:hypothetical protein